MKCIAAKRETFYIRSTARASEAYWGMGGLADGLREVQASAQKFLDANDPNTALTILLALIEAVANSHSYEYLDGSSFRERNNELGDFMNGVGLPLAEAILSVEYNENERAQLAQKLKKWERELSDYGMEEGLELALQAAEYGWNAAPPRRTPNFARGENKDWIKDENEFKDDDEYDDEDEFEIDDADADTRFYVRDTAPDLTEAKLNVLARQNRIEEYLALCQKHNKHLRYARKLIELGRVLEGTNYALERLEFADDALKLAQQLREAKKFHEALAIGEHGLKLRVTNFRWGNGSHRWRKRKDAPLKRWTLGSLRLRNVPRSICTNA